MRNKQKIKAIIPEFTKYRVTMRDDKHLVQIPSFIFFWKPLKIKIITAGLDFCVDAEFKTKNELQDFLKYKIFDTKRIQGLM